MPATKQADTHPDAGTEASLATRFATRRRLTRQLPVTIVAPVRSRQLAPLRRLLERIGEDAAGNAELPFGRLRTAHYARLVLLEESRDLDGEAIPAQLCT